MRISLEHCQWPTVGQSICWSHCAERHVSVLSHWRTNAARRSRMRWSTCSCCCAVFGGSIDEGREFMGAVDDWNTLSFTPQLELTIQTRTVLLKRVSVLGNVVFDVFCTKQMRLRVCGLMQRNTQTKSATTASDQCLDRATWWNRSCWRDVLSRDKLNAICCQERNQVRGHPGIVWRLR